MCVYIHLLCVYVVNHSYTYTLGGLVNCLHYSLLWTGQLFYYDFSLFRQPMLLSIDDATISVLFCGNACEHHMHIQLHHVVNKCIHT